MDIDPGFGPVDSQQSLSWQQPSQQQLSQQQLWSQGSGAGDTDDDHQAQSAPQHVQQPEEDLVTVSGPEVLDRIESCTLWFLSDLRAGAIPDLQLAGRSNRRGSGGGADADGTAGMRVISFLNRQAERADTYARSWKVLEVVQHLLLEGRQATQRDLYYSLSQQSDVINTPRDVSEAILDAAVMLQAPRAALNVLCASRGAVAGRLILFGHPDAPESAMDCSTFGTQGVAIPGDPAAIEAVGVQTDAQAIFVIEKEAVFQRLIEDGFCEEFHSILVTAKGMPDLATRVFLHKLHRQCGGLPLFGVVDWNPSGANILSVYKHGSATVGPESLRYAATPLRWLGITSHMLQGISQDIFQPLTSRDRALINSLSEGPLAELDAWTAELQMMADIDRKADIEALYTLHGPGTVAAMLIEGVQQGTYLPG